MIDYTLAETAGLTYSSAAQSDRYTNTSSRTMAKLLLHILVLHLVQYTSQRSVLVNIWSQKPTVCETSELQLATRNILDDQAFIVLS